MNRSRPSRQLTSLVAVLLRFAAACWLAGSGVLHPAAVHAQSGPGWSAPTLFYSDEVESHKNSLTSDGSGSAHLVWVGSDPGAYYYSRWDGAGWTPPIDVIATVDGSDLGVPELVAGTDGKLHLFWAMGTIMYSWAWADGAGSPHSWSTPTPLVAPNGFAGGPMGAAQDRLGNWHLVYALGSEDDVYYVFSEDDGLTWSEPVRVSQAGPGLTTFGPKIDIGTNGRLHVVWSEWPPESGGPATENKVYYTQSDDGGVSWSIPRQLGELANAGGNVLAGPDGAVYLAWQAGIASPNEGRFLQRSTDGGETWDAPIKLSPVKAQSGIPGMALDSVGTLHLITGDGEYVSYDGERTSPPLDLRPLPEQTENSRLAVVGGNQVLAVVMPFSLPGMYSLSKQLPAPALLAAAAPAPTPAAATPASAATVVIVTDTPAPMMAVAPIAGEWATEQPESSTTPVLLLSAGITLVLVVVVMIWQLIRRRW